MLRIIVKCYNPFFSLLTPFILYLILASQIKSIPLGRLITNHQAYRGRSRRSIRGRARRAGRKETPSTTAGKFWKGKFWCRKDIEKDFYVESSLKMFYVKKRTFPEKIPRRKNIQPFWFFGLFWDVYGYWRQISWWPTYRPKGNLGENAGNSSLGILQIWPV